MFLAAVARPRYDLRRRTYIDGKLIICPIVGRVQAQRSSANRQARDWETKKHFHGFRRVRKDAGGEGFPSHTSQMARVDPLRVQHDNASPHGAVTRATVKQAAKEGGWDIRMEFQPPKSPDMNILDLGIFNAIQSVQYRQPTYKIDALIEIVMAAFNMGPSRTLDKCFLTLQKVMECIIRHAGDNDFRLPRVSKLYIKNGFIPSSIVCNAAVYANGKTALMQMQ
ncbi:hypothetical protein PC123_g20441 [Phytophthora cactorum]|nr:hypothetical protein PC120_g10361 [Phytophthora cactorum]KAG4044099.1 hypothetical protein PC123_g20441 [Phytophthora cactorum]